MGQANLQISFEWLEKALGIPAGSIMWVNSAPEGMRGFSIRVSSPFIPLVKGTEKVPFLQPVKGSEKSYRVIMEWDKTEGSITLGIDDESV